MEALRCHTGRALQIVEDLDLEAKLHTAAIYALNNRVRQAAVFGRVTNGMDVVQKIEQTPTRSDRPVTPVQMVSVTIQQ